MTTLTRKQREVLERETLILNVARRLLLRHGFAALSMDRIAEEIEYSKGTIYQHFSCKEDLVAALVIETMEHRRRIFEKAASFRGRARERMTAVGVADELFHKLYPDHSRAELMVKGEQLWEKASPDRRNILLSKESSCAGVVIGLVTAGVADGDLTLPEGVGPEDVCFGLWSMASGACLVRGNGLADLHLGLADEAASLMQNYQRLLDGYGWRPLSTEWDYRNTVERVTQEVFADELRATR